MRPLLLKLKGFAGIRAGLGRDEITLDLQALSPQARIVALTGPNGIGKSTLIDNLQPFRLLPSRAAGSSPAGFSFYEHLSGPEALKDLEWEHRGVRYRSVLAFRQNGRRRCDAFVYALDGERWRAVQLPDGTLSNGSTDTYDRIVQAVLGGPETFFTSAFSAQNRRPLATFGNAEAKALLADLLGLDEIRRRGEQAAQVQRALRAALEERRARLREREATAGALAGVQEQQRALEAQLEEALRAEEDRLSQVAQAQEAVALAQARTEQMRQAAQQRGQLEATLQAEARAAAEEERAIEERLRALKARAGMAEAEARQRAQELAEQRKRLEAAAGEAQAVLGQQERIRAAHGALEGAARAVATAAAALEKARIRAHEAGRLEAERRLLGERLQSLEQKAGVAVLRERELRARLGLAEEVPCRGMEMQERCRLLGDAREARPLVPSAAQEVQRIGEERARAEEALRRLESACSALNGAPEDLRQAEASWQEATRARERIARDAALLPAIDAARGRLQQVQADLAALQQAEQRRQAALSEALEGARAEMRQAEKDAARVRREREQRLDALKEQLRALPPLDEDGAPRTLAALQAAQKALVLAQQRRQGAAEAVSQCRARTAVLEAAQRDAAALTGAVQHLQEEIGRWALLAKGLGGDGVVALCIDEAGPALAHLANELLAACYGPRFTVSIRTQVTTARGEAREGFEVMVFDAATASSRSVALMSGGERVWINECLTRAVALYLARCTDQHFDTLFCDETDGPLDPERKRMFMAMKREVLRLGGYAREYFISQTPELADLADARIDIGALSAAPA